MANRRQPLELTGDAIAVAKTFMDLCAEDRVAFRRKIEALRLLRRRGAAHNETGRGAPLNPEWSVADDA